MLPIFLNPLSELLRDYGPLIESGYRLLLLGGPPRQLRTLVLGSFAGFDQFLLLPADERSSVMRSENEIVDLG